ncbi:MAG: hypothetical protein AMXMBFR13_11680 [Phycisphaerae bacterium]
MKLLMGSVLPLCGMLLGLGVNGARAGVIVRFDPPAQTVQLHDVFTVDLVADLGEPVIGWGLDVQYDGLLLSAMGSPVIGSSWISASAADGDGLAALAFPSEISGTGVRLATLTLSADAQGLVELLASATPGDGSEGFPLFASGFADVTFMPGQVTVVPEPLTGWWLAFGWLLIRRRF